MAGPSTGLITPMADKIAFEFESPGSTYGSETGQYYQWGPEESVVAPENDFEHMPEAAYETRPLKPSEKPDDDGESEESEESGEETEAEDLLELVEDVEALEDEILAHDGDLEAVVAANEGSSGWYELPGVTKNLRADNALALLELVVG